MSPEIDLVHQPTPPTRSQRTVPQSSQITLIGTAPTQPDPGPSTTSRLVRPPKNQTINKGGPKTASTLVTVHAESPSTPAKPTSATLPRRKLTPYVDVPAKPKPQRGRAIRKEMTAPEPSSGAYMRTRSRSQSVTPEALGAVSRNRGKGGKGKEKAIFSENSEEEEFAFEASSSRPLTETMRDEQQVASILGGLGDDDEPSETANKDEETVSVPPNTSGLSQKRQLDTDDAQVKQMLERALQQPPREYIIPQYEEVLPIQKLKKPRLSKPGGTGNQKILSSPVRTPQGLGRHSISRPVPEYSPSSAESFPLTGTKASAVKRKLVEERKQLSYTPLLGTRAAVMAKLRTRK